ncbi:WD repeat-containing protein 47 [Eumeta japonica]|uniref:WD repeat-containing protein 47 n=1 Tax=Eumeta variegata TaxID=151549 RepID=A0A4C2A207_EUMVA|nr:WD repeat-containing protein 47 [Eumeta japonica]
MPSTHLNLREDDVVRLALEFLHNRDLHITQLSLERETGVINGNYADDVLFLRQLILDGQWDDVLEFIQPLGALRAFEADKFNYAILRHKYIELLCIKSEIKAYNNVENIVEEIVKVLSQLERLAPSKEEYSNLCLLLTLPSITDHAQFKKWNPSNARVQCFREVYPLVEHFLPCDKKSSGHSDSKCSKNDRLMQLLIKGLLYESCVNYCQAKATGSKEAQSSDINFSKLLDGSGFDESDLSLLSWLQSIPAETFSVPFEQRTLNVDVERLERPSLHTSWTEHMLVTPIKPRTFPHLAMPFRRPRSAADAMTRSLRPLPDGAPRHPALMALSAMDYGPSVYSSCFAGFHLTGIKGNKLMNTSVDRLFENNDEHAAIILDDAIKAAVGIETAKTKEASSVTASNATTPEHRGQGSSASVSTSVSTAVSTERSSLAEKTPQQPQLIPSARPDAVANFQWSANARVCGRRERSSTVDRGMSEGMYYGARLHPPSRVQGRPIPVLVHEPTCPTIVAARYKITSLPTKINNVESQKWKKSPGSAFDSDLDSSTVRNIHNSPAAPSAWIYN